MTDPNSEQYDVVDKTLMAIDAIQIGDGAPILSVVAIDDRTGGPGAAFWDSVTRYNLRRPGESDADMIARLRQEAQEYYMRTKKVDQEG